jgi:hypothetical protein
MAGVIEGLLALCLVVFGYGICWITAVRPLRRAAAAGTAAGRLGQRAGRRAGGQGEPRVPERAGPPRRRTRAALAAAEPGPAVAPAAPSIEQGRIYAERLGFSVVRAGSGAAAEPRFRVAVERELIPYAGRYSNLDVVERQVRNDADFRDRLLETAADYLAGQYGDPVVARAAGQVWVTSQSFPETDLADVCGRISDGLTTLVERPLAAAGAQLRIPGPVDAAGAGIGAGLILEPVSGALGDATRLCEIVGVGIGLLTGLHPLVLASAKLLARGELHRQMARGLVEAGKSLFRGEPSSRAEPGDRSPAVEPSRAPADSRAVHPADWPPGVLSPEETTVPSSWRGGESTRDADHDGWPVRPRAHAEYRAAAGEEEPWVDGPRPVRPGAHPDRRAAANEVEDDERDRSRTRDRSEPARGGPRGRGNGSYGAGRSDRG